MYVICVFWENIYVYMYWHEHRGRRGLTCNVSDLRTSINIEKKRVYM